MYVCLLVCSFMCLMLLYLHALFTEIALVNHVLIKIKINTVLLLLQYYYYYYYL